MYSSKSKELKVAAFQMDTKVAFLKAQIGAINFLTTNNVLGSAVRAGVLTYQKMESTQDESSNYYRIKIFFEEGVSKHTLSILITDKNNILVKDEFPETSNCVIRIMLETEGGHRFSEDHINSFVSRVISAVEDSSNDVDDLKAKLSRKQEELQEAVEKKKNSTNNAYSISCLVIIVFIIVMIGMFIWGVFFNSAPSGSTNQEEKMEETLEFADNIDTPGTSEYKWYHDEYLPDNGYPDN